MVISFDTLVTFVYLKLRKAYGIMTKTERSSRCAGLEVIIMKVICDVCGTTFPETATHCPICGCAKPPMAETIPGEDTQAVQESTTAHTYAKGGRFSEKNVQRAAIPVTVAVRATSRMAAARH